MIVRVGLETDVKRAALLHAEAIDEGFLPTLGLGFLNRLYRRIIRWPHSFLLVAEEGGTVIGHAAGSEDVGGLYRQFLLRDGVTAGVMAAPRLMRSWRRALETLRYPSGAEELPRAELLAVAVAPARRGQGVGKALVAAANEEFLRRGVRNAKVVVASSNVPALKLYGSSGYRRSIEIHVHAGVPSQVLMWS